MLAKNVVYKFGDRGLFDEIEFDPQGHLFFERGGTVWRGGRIWRVVDMWWKHDVSFRKPPTLYATRKTPGGVASEINGKQAVKLIRSYEDPKAQVGPIRQQCTVLMRAASQRCTHPRRHRPQK
jgi:hypothetical protein